MLRSRFHEYEEEKLRSPAYCKQENTTFTTHINRTWMPSLYFTFGEVLKGRVGSQGDLGFEPGLSNLSIPARHIKNYILQRGSQFWPCVAPVPF